MFNKKLKSRITELEGLLSSSRDNISSLRDKLKAPKNRPDLPWADHDMTPEERTMKAKEIISNPLMMEIFRGLEDGLSNGARSADLSNHVELMSYTMGLQILDQIVDYIEDRITDEKVVEYNQKVANVANFKH